MAALPVRVFMPNSTSREPVWVLAGLAIGYAAARFLSARRPRASHQSVHVLVVQLKFSTAAQKEAWKKVWSNAARAVYSNEPRCLSYEFCDAEADPTEAIIYERYASRSDLDGPHQATVADFVKACGAELAALGDVDQTLTHYTESNVGHMDR